MTPQRRRLLAAAIVAAAGAFGAGVLAQPKEKVIRITARKFAFLPGEITLKRGVPVVLEFVSADGVMGFNAPDFKHPRRHPPGAGIARALHSGQDGLARLSLRHLLRRRPRAPVGKAQGRGVGEYDRAESRAP